jgi:cyclohexyl-isocyanide hydratase
MGDRSSSVEHARSTQQERSGADRSDTTRLLHSLPQPVNQHRVGGSRVDAWTTGDDQRVRRRSGAWQRAGCDPKSGRSRYLSIFRQYAQDVRRHSSGFRDVIVGADEHLKRACDIEQLHRRVRQHLDDASRTASNRSWLETRGLWHFGQKLFAYAELVHPNLKECTMIPHDTHLQIGSLLFEGLDQIDLTGPFEVLSRIPNSTYRLYGKTAEPVRDLKGLRLTPDAVLADAPHLDVLHVPGGFGQEALMEDTEVLAWIRQQAAGARSVFSVCTGALLCGAAGLLKGRRATTHWASFHLLPYFGAIPVNERVVVDGNWVFAAGVTAGIDGALRLAAELRGDDAARTIQLHMVYAPEPPFDSGTPETAPAAILAQARQSVAGITAQREATARRVAACLGVDVAEVAP